MYPYSVMQLLVGLLIEKFGGRRSLAYGVMLFASGSLCFPMIPWTWERYAARFLTGIGAITIYLSIINEGRTLFPQEVPQISGLIIMTGYLGCVVAGSPFSSFSGSFGVQNVLIVMGCITTILAILYFCVYCRMTCEPIKTEGFSLAGYKEVIQLPLNWYVIGSYAMSFGVFYTLETVMGKKFLQDNCGFQSVNAAYVFSGVVFMSAIGSMLQGGQSFRKTTQNLFRHVNRICSDDGNHGFADFRQIPPVLAASGFLCSACVIQQCRRCGCRSDDGRQSKRERSSGCGLFQLYGMRDRGSIRKCFGNDPGLFFSCKEYRRTFCLSGRSLFRYFRHADRFLTDRSVLCMEIAEKINKTLFNLKGN